MDADFVRLVKQKKRKRLIFIAVIAALAAAAVILLLLRFGRSGQADASVTLEIRCDQLSEHPEALKDEGLRSYVPEDGVILAERECPVRSGVSTVFDVIDEACREEDIQIEYSTAAGIGGHYIEGINYLYEFSAGKYSGWMFTVDGEISDYGCDQVVLKGGEKIVWYYTVDYR